MAKIIENYVCCDCEEVFTRQIAANARTGGDGASNIRCPICQSNFVWPLSHFVPSTAPIWNGDRVRFKKVGC
jgi:hypothetical protein